MLWKKRSREEPPTEEALVKSQPPIEQEVEEFKKWRERNLEILKRLKEQGHTEETDVALYRIERGLFRVQWQISGMERRFSETLRSEFRDWRVEFRFLLGLLFALGVALLTLHLR